MILNELLSASKTAEVNLTSAEGGEEGRGRGLMARSGWKSVLINFIISLIAGNCPAAAGHGPMGTLGETGVRQRRGNRNTTASSD